MLHLSNTKVCFSCLVRAFPEWTDARVSAWLIQQAERAVYLANFVKAPICQLTLF